jgi:hypothetical protein
MLYYIRYIYIYWHVYIYIPYISYHILYLYILHYITLYYIILYYYSILYHLCIYILYIIVYIMFVILYYIISHHILYYIISYYICIWVWPNQEVLTASLTSFAWSSSNWWSIHTQKLGFRLDVCRPRQTPRKFAHFGKLLAPVTHICLRSMKKDDSREWLQQQAQRTDYFNLERIQKKKHIQFRIIIPPMEILKNLETTKC